jgi:hypothetical protein
VEKSASSAGSALREQNGFLLSEEFIADERDSIVDSRRKALSPSLSLSLSLSLFLAFARGNGADNRTASASATGLISYLKERKLVESIYRPM